MTLRVTVEIVPHGVEEDKYEIGTLNIHNSGKKVGDFYYYYGSYIPWNSDEGFEFKDIKHDRRHGALALVQAILKEQLL